MGLQVHPELWRISEIQAEPQRGVGSDAPAVVDDLCNTVRRDPNSLGELILGQAVLCQKLLFQHLTGRDRCKLAFGHLHLLHLINYAAPRSQ